MRWLGILGAGAICILLALSIDPALAARRVALVIGNDAYRELPVLRKAVADAEGFAAVLSEKGFDQVVLKRDLTRSEMDVAIAAFLDGIAPGDTAVFVYSGHGWSDGAQNYLVGIDAPRAGAETLLSRLSVPLQNGANGVVDEMTRRGALLKVAIIDACRDNPFVSATPGRSIGLGRGLSRVEPPSGTFVVFSAGAGQSALDRLSDGDTDANGLFTRVFLPLIRADLPLLDAVKETQQRVFGAARTIDHEQRPAYYDEVLGSACLSNACRPLGAGLATAVLPVDERETTFWKSIAAGTRAADFKAYLEQFPNGTFAKLARLRIDEIEASVKPTVVDPPPAPPPPAPVVSAPPDAEPVTAPEAIKEAQERLFALNFDPGSADGRLGGRTVAAIRSFQAENGLSGDGVLTQATLAMLRTAPERQPWGAIVYSEAEGNFGMAWGKESRDAALAAAQLSCGLKGRCASEVTFFTGWCGVFAHGDKGFALIARRSLEAARDEALSACRAKDKACALVATICADGGGKFLATSN